MLTLILEIVSIRDFHIDILNLEINFCGESPIIKKFMTDDLVSNDSFVASVLLDTVKSGNINTINMLWRSCVSEYNPFS